MTGRAVRWLYPQWVGAALCAGVLLLLLIPALVMTWDRAVVLTFLLLPVYMIHQVEEHDRDRFRRFVNREVFGGAEALDEAAILWINIPGVWGVGVASVYAGWIWGAGWGLAMVYLVLVNAVVHIAAGAAKRRYNPGLWTAIVLFVPAGGAALAAIGARPGVGMEQHAAGLGAAVAIHAAIVVGAGRRAATLRASRSTR